MVKVTKVIRYFYFDLQQFDLITLMTHDKKQNLAYYLID